MSPARRVLARGLLVVALGLGTAGCSGEAGPVDDGTLSSLRAGAPATLEKAGVDLISLDSPVGASPDEVVAALEAERFDPQVLDALIDSSELEPERIAGLLGVVSDIDGNGRDGRYVVLAFADLESAVVFAASEPRVFADAGLETARTSYFSGNLVGYYAAEGDTDATDRFRAALEVLSEA